MSLMMRSRPARALTQGRRTDWVLLAAATTLSLFSVVLVYSTTHSRLTAAGDLSKYFAIRQLIFVILGMTIGLVVSHLDRYVLRSSALVLYGVSVAGLLAVLTPLGTEINGTRAWIVLPGGFTVQPAEFAKVAVIVLAATWLSDRSGVRGISDPPDLRSVMGVLGATGLVIGLLILQPDVGSAMVLALAVLGVLAVSGARWQLLAGLVGTAGLAAIAAAVLGMLDQYQIDRFTAFLQPDADRLGAGYNVYQALIATGTGGLTGQGLFNGGQTQGAFVPYQYTDFIFSAAAEELGFIGAAVIVGLLTVILLRGIDAASRAIDSYDQLVASGVVVWLAAQGFENIGMNLGLLPVTGVPLPLLSYGGSSIIAAWIGVGLLVHVGRR